MIWAFISPTFSLIRSATSFLPLKMASRASMTHLGQSESVVRGQPSVGFVFCHDLSKGLSDHLVVKDGFGLYWLTVCIALNTPPATSARPFSTCLIGRIYLFSPLKLNLIEMLLFMRILVTSRFGNLEIAKAQNFFVSIPKGERKPSRMYERLNLQ